MTKGKFELGQTVMTRGVSEFMKEEEIVHGELVGLLARHQTGDWGDVVQDDWQANEDALEFDGRLLSAYEFYGKRIWIITEWDRSVTTVLFPDEY